MLVDEDLDAGDNMDRQDGPMGELISPEHVYYVRVEGIWHGHDEGDSSFGDVGLPIRICDL